jgi:5-methylcytosine-specific restriction endonuclease McrA
MTIRNSSFKKKGRTRKEIAEDYKINGRFIAPRLLQKLRKIKKCFYCKKPFKKQTDRHIHHLKPIRYGGSSLEPNLAVVHKQKCHLEMDKRSEKKYGKKKEHSSSR